MLKIVLVAAFIGFAAAQLGGERAATVVRQTAENSGDGTFNYAYETSNGLQAQASGYIKNPQARSEDQIQVIQGSYSYYGADGVLYTVTYIADENGFQPQGSHLPTAAPAAPVRFAPTQRPFRG